MSDSSPPDHSEDRPAIVVIGPTAGGKTSLAVQLAQQLPGGGECINADSMQVYRGMNIGTAKPTADERCGVPHHLIDVADPSEPFTLDQWHSRANVAVADIRSRGKWPIVVGGTHLYVQAFLFGLLDAPGPNPALRAELELLDEVTLRAKLDAADPVAATTIHANDRRRTIRALEVAATGRTISSLQTQWTSPPRPDALLIGLSWPTAAINARINERVRCMLKQGLLEEVRALAPMLGPQAAAALGYKQFLEVLDGTDTQLNDAGEQVKIRTRRFAKGQRTWLRRFQGVKLSLWLDAPNKDPQHIATEALTWVLKQGHG